MELAFKEMGAGKPFVILHGLLGSSDNWLGIAPALAEHFHLFLLDLRNHGKSPSAAAMNYTLMVQDVLNFFDAQSIATAHLMGHSMGGKVAMTFALTHPDCVEKLIVEDMAPRIYKPSHDVILAAMLALDLKSFQYRQEIEDALAPQVHSLPVRRFLLKNLGRDAHGAFEWKTNLQGIADNYARLLEPLAAATPVQNSALFIRGENSNHIRTVDEPGIRELFPNSEIQTIPGAGHWVHSEAPAEFSQRVLRFLG